ncbi:MAG: GNAT family N-acetyltransferase [Microthrixaceae bacterium]
MDVRHEPDNDSYVAEIDGDQAGVIEYLVRGDDADRYVLAHTVVGDDFGGKGVGSALASFALDDARTRGLKVVPLCPFVEGYIERHPEYADLVDTELFDAMRK